MRTLALLLFAACSNYEPLECVELAFEVKRTLTFELSPARAEQDAKTLVQIWDSSGVPDSSATLSSCLLVEGVPDEIEVIAPRFTPTFVLSYATIRSDLEGDGIGGCDLFGLQSNDLVRVPTSTGAYTIAVEMDETDDCR